MVPLLLCSLTQYFYQYSYVQGRARRTTGLEQRALGSGMEEEVKKTMGKKNPVGTYKSL